MPLQCDKQTDGGRCPNAATQMHGPPDDPIYTCDEHAEEAMLYILKSLGLGTEGDKAVGTP